MKRFLLLLLLTVPAIFPSRADNHPTPSATAPSEQSSDQVKNLIFLIGDGMGLGQVSMLMIEEGYEPTAFNRARNVALISTYSANNRVTDSAAAGTALATGNKTDNSKLGVLNDGSPVESMIAKAIRENRPAGVVVTSTLQHATPGAFYAHANHRKQEDLIARQLVTSGLDVALGGGKALMEKEQDHAETLLAKMEDMGYTVVDELDELDAIDRGRVIGVFADGHMPPMKEGRGDYLPRAVTKALEILSNNADAKGTGFVLMIEGSQIDFESHGNDPKGILAEMRDFNRAVTLAMDFADRNPGTLVVVTADHETGGLTMPSGKKDFTLSDSGIDYKFSTTSHTGILVPVYLYGTGAERINGILDNTQLSNKLMELLQLP